MASPHGDTVYVCSECTLIFPETQLLSHVHQHVTPPLHHCTLCVAGHASRPRLKQHLLVHVKHIIHPLEIGDKETKPEDVNVKSNQCTKCGKCCASVEILAKHVKIHVDVKPHQCTTCGKCFGNEKHLTKHVALMHIDKPHECDVCGKCFDKKQYLGRHALIHRTEGKPFSCGVCGNRFKYEDSLKHHTEAYHSPQPPQQLPHPCQLCGKAFTLKDALKRHMWRHNDEYPYRCTYPNCNKGFAVKKAMNIHIEAKHVKSYRERGSRCDRCGRLFVIKDYLLKHQLTCTADT